MNYPDDFNTRTFPAGKSIAISRAMGVGIMVAFFIIVCLCGLILWTMRSTRIEPFILATGGVNDQWRIIMAGNNTPTTKMTGAQVFQQSLIWHFTQNWFSISQKPTTNADVWNTECEYDDCASGIGDSKHCAIYCATSDDLFRRFTANVLPQYRILESSGATWMVVPESMRIEPVGAVSDDRGTWRIRLTVLMDGGNRAMDVVAYARVERNSKYFPATRGYFVADFNAYRVSQ